MARAETARYINYPTCNSSAAEGMSVGSTDEPGSLATFMKWTTLILAPQGLAEEEATEDPAAGQTPGPAHAPSVNPLDVGETRRPT